jgi:hypothetical protein
LSDGRSFSGGAVAIYTVRQGKRYRATITLGLVERIANNDMIAERLRDAGFADITVSGSGGTRIAEARWPNEDASAEMPKNITEVIEL